MMSCVQYAYTIMTEWKTSSALMISRDTAESCITFGSVILFTYITHRISGAQPRMQPSDLMSAQRLSDSIIAPMPVTLKITFAIKSISYEITQT